MAVPKRSKLHFSFAERACRLRRSLPRLFSRPPRAMQSLVCEYVVQKTIKRLKHSINTHSEPLRRN